MMMHRIRQSGSPADANAPLAMPWGISNHSCERLARWLAQSHSIRCSLDGTMPLKRNLPYMVSKDGRTVAAHCKTRTCEKA